jgi:hypothetical protein
MKIANNLLSLVYISLKYTYVIVPVDDYNGYPIAHRIPRIRVLIKRSSAHLCVDVSFRCLIFIN